jgi:hypothetical protein
MDDVKTKPRQRQVFAALNNKHKGKLMEIAVHKLVIPDQGDEGYQREAVTGHSARIAANFDWRLFGVLDVVRRADYDGRLEVADGGNRLRAVLMRGDIAEVPCIVHIANSNEEAASIFTGINVNRRAISFAPLHKAMLLAQDEVHLLAQRAWDELNQNGHVVFEPMKPIVKFCRKENEHEALWRLLPVLRQLAFEFPRVRMSADFFKGIVLLETAIAPATLSHPKWLKKMKQLGLSKLTDFAGVRATSGRHPALFAKILAGRDRLNIRPNPFEVRNPKKAD